MKNFKKENIKNVEEKDNNQDSTKKTKTPREIIAGAVEMTFGNSILTRIFNLEVLGVMEESEFTSDVYQITEGQEKCTVDQIRLVELYFQSMTEEERNGYIEKINRILELEEVSNENPEIKEEHSIADSQKKTKKIT